MTYRLAMVQDLTFTNSNISEKIKVNMQIKIEECKKKKRKKTNQFKGSTAY